MGGGEQKQGTAARNRSCTKGHAAAAATRETVERYLPMPDAIKHFINESFQLLARDFTLSHVPRQQGTIAGLNILH